MKQGKINASFCRYFTKNFLYWNKSLLWIKKKEEERGIAKNDILCLSLPYLSENKSVKNKFSLFSLFPFLSFFMEGHSSNNNLYRVLGIQKTATPEEIKKVISRLL
jgi:hypothetical protein